jgi:energy-converting hydrogenase Eha subunit F
MCSSVITSVKQVLNSLTNPQCLKVLSSLTFIFVVLQNFDCIADIIRAQKYVSPYLHVPFHKTEKF